VHINHVEDGCGDAELTAREGASRLCTAEVCDCAEAAPCDPGGLERTRRHARRPLQQGVEQDGLLFPFICGCWDRVVDLDGDDGVCWSGTKQRDGELCERHRRHSGAECFELDCGGEVDD
jgi:hypothetical protein